MCNTTADQLAAGPVQAGLAEKPPYGKTSRMLMMWQAIALCAILLAGCGEILDKRPLDNLVEEDLFSDPEGVKVYLANLYNQLPVEDFAYFREGFNFNGPGPNNGGLAPAAQTDEAVHSEFGHFMGDEDFHWWNQGYELIRDVNILVDILPAMDIGEEDFRALSGEAAFIRAYAYFALAKRYGGIPLITGVQDWEGDVEALKVPRSTEKETWDFVLQECDRAIQNLPDSWPGGERRGTRWVAYALKSRAALHAASLAKYGNRAPMSGAAVNQELVGLEISAADEYYRSCIEASEEIMNAGMFSLFRPDPASPEEAAENYRRLFEFPNEAQNEAMFIKGFARPGDETAHNYDIWYGPNQTANGWPHPGRMNPSLELMDVYERYDNPGESAPIVTVETGDDTDDYSGFDPSKQYRHFDEPSGIFEGKDARLWGTAILPGTTWKGEEIVIQAGLIRPDGSPQIMEGEPVTHNGTTYYTYGAADRSRYSGFDPWGGNYTRTGAGFKKFLSEGSDVSPAWNQSTTDYIDFRYAEILLNYAEAVVESGYTADNAQNRAAEAVNALRHRAGHTGEVPLSLENVLRERRVELAFENKRFWDLIRRREFHRVFNNTVKHSLLPVLDLRTDPPQYIFIRQTAPRLVPATFDPKHYYRSIPGIGANDLVQNPQY